MAEPGGPAAAILEAADRHFGLPGPLEASPLRGGLNNFTFCVRTAGGRYAARLYRNLDPPVIRREHALLRLLASAGLSFAVPVPLAGRGGETIAPTALGSLALFSWVDGDAADGGNPAHLRAMGAALAELDDRLLHLDARLHHLPGPAAPVHGQLELVHPAVPVPAALADRLAAHPALQPAEAELRWLRAATAECAEALPRLYGTLPRQWIHQDLALTNVLQAGGRVTGLLDFEFSDYDLRALDLVAALSNCTSLQEEAGWAQAGAICAGYCRRVRLSEAEVLAVPLLMRLRHVVVNLHGAGRWLAGLNPVEEVLRRLRDGAARDGALRRQAGRLEELVRNPP